MNDSITRAIKEREIQILKFKLEKLDKPYALYYAAAALLAFSYFEFVGPYVFGAGFLPDAIAAAMIFIVIFSRIIDFKHSNESIRKKITLDMANARVQEISVKEAILLCKVKLGSDSFFCFAIGGDKTLLLNGNIIDAHYAQYEIFEPPSVPAAGGGDAKPAETNCVSVEGTRKLRRNVDGLNFPSDEFSVTLAPESGGVLSVRTAGKRVECERTADYFAAECHKDCEIVDAAPIEFLKQPGETYFKKAHESVKINKKSLIFNELAGAFAGAAIFYGLGYDTAHGAALGWAASYTLGCMMILLFDGMNKYNYYSDYLAYELKAWQYGDNSIHSQKLQAVFIAINTAVMFVLLYAGEPGLPYPAILAASFAIAIILLFLPVVHLASGRTFVIEIAVVATLYLAGFHEIARNAFMIICMLMLLIGLADKQRKIGMSVLKFFVDEKDLDDNKSRPLIEKIEKTEITRKYALRLKYVFTVFVALLAMALAAPSLPEMAYSEYGKKILNGRNAFNGGRSAREAHGIEFVYIPAGSFAMGGDEKYGGEDDERPVHKVTITKGFYLSATEITQKQWQSIMGEPAPCRFEGDNLPVENVNWNDCMDFVKKINLIHGKQVFRLPTEAEWEYACRANGKFKYCFGNDSDRIDEYAWHCGNSDDRTHPVGRKTANNFGLYDMHANVWEWCLDNYVPYEPQTAVDPRGPVSNSAPGDKKVIRGGGWFNSKSSCTSSNRDAVSEGKRSSDIGFRLLMIDEERSGDNRKGFFIN